LENRFLTKFSCVLAAAIVAMGIATPAMAGQFKGAVKDTKTSETVIGAIVVIAGSHLNTTTDFDGNFRLNDLPQGHYNAFVTYIGYKRTDTFSFEMPSDTTVIEHDFRMESTEHELKAVVVSGKLNTESDQFARKTEENAANLVNIMSARAIQISPDITVANVMQRISGISLERSNNGDGRYAIIRGMDKRYTYTMIDGVKIPSPDNKNRFVPLDIFPADIMERIEVNKTVTPSMEGDAIGGSLNMVLKNAPDQLSLNVNLGSGFSEYFFNNPFISFNKSVIQQQSPLEKNGPNYLATSNDFTRANLDFKNTTALPYGIIGASIGNRFFNKKLGILVAGSYQNTNRGSNNIYFPTVTSITNTPAFKDIINRNLSSNLIRSAVHAKVDYKFNDKHQVSLYGIYTNLQDIESRISYDTSLTATRTLPGTGKVTTLSRSRDETQYIGNITLQGKDALLPEVYMDWSSSYAIAGTKVPDWAELNTFTSDTLHNGVPGASPATLQNYNRIWEHNTDHTVSEYLNLHYTPTIWGKEVEFSAGGMFRHQDRDNYFNTYTLQPVLVGTPPAFPVYTNIYNAQWSVQDPTGNILAGPNYKAEEEILSYYAQVRLQLNKLQIIGGVRTENTWQGYTSNLTDAVAARSGSITYRDFLPGIHLKYRLRPKQNLRFSVYEAIARPNYFDLVPVGTPATENFGTQGNPTVKHTTSTNYDARYEWYPKPNEQIIIGAFYKDLINPIENTVVFTRAGDAVIQPNNFGNAQNMGFELVGIKYFKNFGVSANYTFTYSVANVSVIKNNVNPVTGGIDSPSTLTMHTTRPLQGQSKHIGNLSLFYKNAKYGLDVQLAYVYTGRRIIQVSQFEGLDYWQRATSQLDFSIEKRIGRRFAVYVKVQNILNTPVIVEINSHYPYPAGEFPFQKAGSNSYLVEKDTYGQTFLFGVRYRL